jgi:hypothetical protein
MKLWMVVKDYLNLLVLNHQKILKLVLRFTELAFSAFFVAKIKPATEPVSKNHGPMLRYALIAINNKLYNYDFGRETYVTRFYTLLVYKMCVRIGLHSFVSDASLQPSIPVLCDAGMLNDLRGAVHAGRAEHHPK